LLVLRFKIPSIMLIHSVKSFLLLHLPDFLMLFILQSLLTSHYQRKNTFLNSQFLLQIVLRQNAIFMPFLNTTWLVSDSSRPLMILIIVVFQNRFWQWRQFFWSLLIPNEMSLNNVRSPKDFEIFSTER
jgi:hypothetical protein